MRKNEKLYFPGNDLWGKLEILVQTLIETFTLKEHSIFSSILKLCA